jgi:hypothetical protein
MDEARDLVDAVAAVALGEREQNLLLMVSPFLTHPFLFTSTLKTRHTAMCFTMFALQLEKARADKDKAIRVLVKIAGKVIHTSPNVPLHTQS